MKFLLPDRIPQFDFQYQLIAAQDYWTNFKNHTLDIVYANDYINGDHAIAHDKWKDYCPVGSLEFCKKCGVITKPRNIPPQLKKYAIGDILTTKSDIAKHPNKSGWFVKSSLNIKDERNAFFLDEKHIPFEDNEFIATPWLDKGFDAEYRIFVHNGDIVDIQNYAGDLWILPNKNTVEHMIYDFRYSYNGIVKNDMTPALTFDVGISEGKTYIIEVHDFYSCGTYNFSDHYRLPMMLRDWYTWYRMHNL